MSERNPFSYCSLHMYSKPNNVNNEQEQLHTTSYRYEGRGSAEGIKRFGRGHSQECA